MKELYDLEECLLDDDGSCRDITYKESTWPGVKDLVTHLCTSYGTFHCADNNGKELKSLDEILDHLANIKTTASFALHLDNYDELINWLNVFVFLNNDDTPSIELSFSPRNINKVYDLRKKFIIWANEKKSILQASLYVVGYESSFSQFEDIQPETGIFFISD